MSNEFSTHIVAGSVVVTSPFGNRVNPVTGHAQFHRGVDLAARPRGNPPIFAFDDGEVITASFSPTAGNWVEIQHPGCMVSVYMHLDVLSVIPGQRVTKWQTLGTMGTTGQSTGVHLHFEIRTNRQAASAVDPMPFLLSTPVILRTILDAPQWAQPELRRLIDFGDIRGTGETCPATGELILNILEPVAISAIIAQRIHENPKRGIHV